MTDQANDLRSLVLRGASHRLDDFPEPRLVAVQGSRPGVGATTVALRLALSLALDGRRLVFIDADAEGSGLAEGCGVEPRFTTGDVLRGERTLHEAFEPGPAGIQLLAGPRNRGGGPEPNERMAQRLLDSLRLLGAYADYILVDAGRAASRWSRRLVDASDAQVMVTTTDPAAVMAAYGGLKAGREQAPAWIVLNRIVDRHAASEAQRRLLLACTEFLERPVLAGGEWSEDPRWGRRRGGSAMGTFEGMRSAAGACATLAARIVSTLARTEGLSAGEPSGGGSPLPPLAASRL